MVIALLLSLTTTVGTGLVVYGAEKHAGPLGGIFAATGLAVLGLLEIMKRLMPGLST
jgi:hypothetical protein